MCLRHGESVNVVSGASGALPDVPLTTVGRAQAAAAARTLAAWPVAHVYTSSATRARQTAEIVASAVHAGVTVMPGLTEIGIGAKEGATDSVTRVRTAEVLRSWIVEGDLSARVADGESGVEVVERMVCALGAIAEAHVAETIVVVGHVGSLTAGLTVLCKDLGPRVWGHPLPHGRCFLVEYDGSAWTCPRWPSDPH